MTDQNDEKQSRGRRCLQAKSPASLHDAATKSSSAACSCFVDLDPDQTRHSLGSLLPRPGREARSSPASPPRPAECRGRARHPRAESHQSKERETRGALRTRSFAPAQRRESRRVKLARRVQSRASSLWVNERVRKTSSSEPGRPICQLAGGGRSVWKETMRRRNVMRRSKHHLHHLYLLLHCSYPRTTRESSPASSIRSRKTRPEAQTSALAAFPQTRRARGTA